MLVTSYFRTTCILGNFFYRVKENRTLCHFVNQGIQDFGETVKSDLIF